MTVKNQIVSELEAKDGDYGVSYTVSWKDGSKDNYVDKKYFDTLTDSAENGTVLTVTREPNPKNPKYTKVKSITVAQPNTSGVAVDSVPPVISQPTPLTLQPQPSTPVTVKSNTPRDRDGDPLKTRSMCLSYAKDMIIPLYRDDIRTVPVRDIELTAERLVMWVYGEVRFDEAELLAPFVKKD
jgi:hypothetical protein